VKHSELPQGFHYNQPIRTDFSTPTRFITHSKKGEPMATELLLFGDWINNLGAVSGYAENKHRDPDCRPGVAINGTGPQVLDFEPVIWGPRPEHIRQRPLLPGDTVGMALGLNDLGQAVGTTGTCANTLIASFIAGPHAVLWDIDGSVHNLGNLGGTTNITLLGAATVAFSTNNRGQVAGVSDLPGDQIFHPSCGPDRPAWWTSAYWTAMLSATALA
jgi:hypothetical protein